MISYIPKRRVSWFSIDHILIKINLWEVSWLSSKKKKSSKSDFLVFLNKNHINEQIKKHIHRSFLKRLKDTYLYIYLDYLKV